GNFKEKTLNIQKNIQDSLSSLQSQVSKINSEVKKFNNEQDPAIEASNLTSQHSRKALFDWLQQVIPNAQAQSLLNNFYARIKPKASENNNQFVTVSALDI